MADSPQRTDRSAAEKRSTKDIVRLAVLGIGLILLIAFIVENSKTVKVNFVFFDAHASLIWVILISAVLGVVVDRMAIVLSRRRKERQ